MTQELLANMLGMRRIGVTDATGKLQREGINNYSRVTLLYWLEKSYESVVVNVIKSGKQNLPDYCQFCTVLPLIRVIK